MIPVVKGSDQEVNISEKINNLFGRILIRFCRGGRQAVCHRGEGGGTGNRRS